MTDLISRSRKQKAVYWGSPVASGFGGYDFDDPVEIKVRWEVRQELFIDMNGKEVRSQAVAYVGQDVDMGGYLFLGELDDLDSTVIVPEDVTTGRVYEIRGFSKSPTLGGTKYVRKVWM
jgi:hypothetical protein